MSRLTETDNEGNWWLIGLPWHDIFIGRVITEDTYEKLDDALCRLMQYEETGLSPEEVERLKG